MIPDFEKITRAITELQVACAAFKAQHPLTTISDNVIQEFLNHTAGIDCPESTKLTSFAGHFFDDIGWDEYYKIYEYILANHGDYGNWIPTGFQLMSDDKQDLDYRIHIAEDVRKIIIQFCDGNYSDPSFAEFWGEFYYRHPLRSQNQSEYPQLATKWLEIDLTQRRDPHSMCRIAEVYLQLGEMDKAAKYYEEALSSDFEGCCELTEPERIRERLSQIKHNKYE